MPGKCPQRRRTPLLLTEQRQRFSRSNVHCNLHFASSPRQTNSAISEPSCPSRPISFTTQPFTLFRSRHPEASSLDHLRLCFYKAQPKDPSRYPSRCPTHKVHHHEHPPLPSALKASTSIHPVLTPCPFFSCSHLALPSPLNITSSPWPLDGRLLCASRLASALF